MEKQFVPYELAVKLKELGFDEPCFAYYEKDGMLRNNLTNIYYAKYIVKGSRACIAPLWQQAFDWFREKYSLEGNFGLCHFTDMTYGYNITSYITNSHYVHQDRNFKTYQSARLACLEKLIELIK